MSLTKNYTKTFSFPVVFSNVPIDKKISNQSLQIKTILSESGWDLIGKNLKNRKIIIDLKNSDTKNNSIHFSNTKSLLTEKFNDLTILETIPSNFTLQLENLIIKKVAVKLNIETFFSANYQFNNATEIRPDSILISSDSATLSQISYIETKSFSITEKDTSKTNILLIIPENIRSNNKTIDAFFNIEEFAEKEFIVPINIENKPENTDLVYYPEKIRLKSLVPFSEYEKITASNFYISADFNNIEVSKDKTIILSIKEKPKSVKNIQLEKDFVEYVLYSK